MVVVNLKADRALRPLLAGVSAVALMVLIAGCAARAPLDSAGVNSALTPGAALDHPAESKGAVVLWGGTIVEARNLDAYTELEVLSYPLKGNQRPDLERSPQGRFKARKAGYLETVDYAPGREVTVRGIVEDSEQGTVGEADYRFAVVDAQQIELWDRRPPYRTEPQVHFGIGVVIGN